LQGMNFSMGDLADAFKVKTPAPAATPSPFAAKPAEKAAEPTRTEDAAKPDTNNAASAEANGKAAPGVVDPLQWWNSLTSQFQQIAASAMQDVTTKTAADTSKAADLAKEAFKNAEEFAKAATKPLTEVVAKAAKPAATAPAKKTPAKKAAAKKRPT
jgi:hypothetical protein